MKKLAVKAKKFFVISLAGVLALFPFFSADSMQSSNYRIDNDSINFGGTDGSESANYRISDSMGEIGTGETGQRCSSLSFDGTDDYVEVPHNVSLQPSSVSVSAWVRLNNDGNRHIIAAKWSGYTLEVDSSGYPYFAISNQQGQMGVSTWAALAQLQFGEWQYITGTFDDSTKEIKIFLNGAEKTSRTLTSSIVYSNNVLRISNTLYGGGAVNGSIDDVRIYNRALSADEISNLYQGGQVDNTGLAAYWGFDEGSGSAVSDLSGNGNNGTVYGAAFSGDYPASTCNIINGGYREMNQTYISITSPADAVISPAVGGVSGGTGDGSAVWNVKTDNPAGYQMSVRAGASPALQSGSYSFADYTPAVSGVPDYDWSISNSASEFGYTVEGDNTVAKFLDNGSACNAGSGNVSSRCWLNFSTTDQAIVNSVSPNHPLGANTTIRFRAQSGNSHLQPEGSYSATITVTAVEL